MFSPSAGGEESDDEETITKEEHLANEVCYIYYYNYVTNFVGHTHLPRLRDSVNALQSRMWVKAKYIVTFEHVL